MKAELPDHITEEKLAKYFAGEASPQEHDEVKSWAEASQENRELLLQLQIVWIDTGHIGQARNQVKKYDVDAAWRKVKAAKATQHESAQGTWFWKIAASVVLLIAAGFLIRTFLFAPDQVTYTAEAISDVQLPDGSSVVLNTGSRLIYPESFSGGVRAVRLEGEAFFEVEHDPGQPFTVTAGDTRVQVLGTAFNVKMNASEVVVMVESGRVLFSGGDGEVILAAGERAVFSPASQQIKKQSQETLTGADQFWRTRTLKFTGQKLPQVIEAIETAYDVNIHLLGDHLSECHLSVTFHNDSLENVLDIIALTLIWR